MPPASERTVPGCNLCDGTEWETIEAAGDTRVVRCACGLVFVTPQPEPATIAACYDEAYYRPWAEQDRPRGRLWRRRLGQVRRLAPPPARLLDVGCGTGTFLRLARAQGWDVTGTEISAHAARAAGDDGLPVVAGEVWEAKFPEEGFDVVTCWHVLEHATDPRRILGECHRVLRPGGWLVLATPNLDDRLFRAAYRLARGRRPPLFEPDERELHLYFFTGRTLRRMAASAGFERIRVGFDRGAAAVGGKRLLEALAFVWFRSTGLHWGMGLELQARRRTGGEPQT